jgi:hypothetical protein
MLASRAVHRGASTLFPDALRKKASRGTLFASLGICGIRFAALPDLVEYAASKRRGRPGFGNADQIMLPFSLLPIILVVLFLLVWGFIAWLKFLEHVHLARYHEQEARSHIVSVRKLGPRRPHLDYEPG